MVVSHNVPALFSHLSMRRADRGLASAMQRLSTGTRINSAREDAAGLAIANKLNFQVGGLNRASENATHGIALIQTAEGALNETHNMLQRMRELAVQAANDTLTEQQKNMIQYEINQLINEMQKISTRTEYNRMRILNGEADRVTEHMTRNAANPTGEDMTRSIVTTLFVSPSVQPGTLNYTIERIGTPAVYQLSHAIMPWTNDPGGTPPTTGSIQINGVPVVVSDGDTWADVGRNFNQALEFAGIKYTNNALGDSHFLVTNIERNNQHLTITGNDTLLTEMGLSNTSANPPRGTNAEIILHPQPGAGVDVNYSGSGLADDEMNGLFDTNGFPVPGSSALVASAEGNKVFIRGARGEDIRLNIQVDFNPEYGNFTFGNGYPATVGTGFNIPSSGLLENLPGATPYGLQKSMALRNFGPLMLQIGPSHNTAMPVQIPRLNAETLGIVEFVGGRQRVKLNYSNTEGAVNALAVVDRAINTVSAVRSRLGAYQNRLESTVRSLDVAAENTESSRSRIQDTDMARESTRFAQYNVMYQAAMAILGQANQRPQQLISLLQ